MFVAYIKFQNDLTSLNKQHIEPYAYGLDQIGMLLSPCFLVIFWQRHMRGNTEKVNTS